MVTKTGVGGTIAGADMAGRQKRDHGTKRVAKRRPRAAAVRVAPKRGRFMERL